MCDQVGRVKVMDFGLAKVLGGASALTATGTAMGTPAYMSPEQCKGEAVDLRTDIYSLGVMLFEMLTGRPPYVGDTPMAVMSQIALSDFPAVRDLNPDVPLGVAFIVKKMVAKNLANRYNSAQALEADIERWLREGDSQLPIEEAVTVRASEEATRLVTPRGGSARRSGVSARQDARGPVRGTGHGQAPGPAPARCRGAMPLGHRRHGGIPRLQARANEGRRPHNLRQCAAAGCLGIDRDHGARRSDNRHKQLQYRRLPR